MKKCTFIFLLAMLCRAENSFARIIRVNNNPGTATQYTTLIAAHDEASNGDTIHLEGSPTSYGTATIQKKLVIIGAGYYLAENPNSQYLPQSSKVGTIQMYAGSKGSVLMGLDFNGAHLAIYSDGIIIKRNRFNQYAYGNPEYNIGQILVAYIYPRTVSADIPVNNILILQNYGVRIDVQYACSGILISNNYIISGGASLEMNANSDAIIRNNIFRNSVSVSNGSTFQNNIMLSGNFNASPTIFTNNIGNSTQFGTENGNKSNITMTSVFVGLGTSPYSDRQWVLKEDSPAKGAAYGSTAQNPIDAGIFGGQLPYVLAGLPSVPAIYYFDATPIGSNTEPINVTIKAKSVN
ncbi:MAG: hypothetical protein KF746_16735 [Chitinophagaceae bacterium]|nr:hypothetical protein [Chitinophagaceae bacterium]